MSAELDRTLIHIVPYHRAPLDALALEITARHSSHLPRLDHVTILLPHPRGIRTLRQALLEAASSHGHSALLGPRIETLAGWARRRNADGPRRLDGPTCELLLSRALKRHPLLLGGADPWGLAESLLKLFHELRTWRVGLPESPEDLEQRLARGYGVQDPSPTPLSREAHLVHVLWGAWREELEEREAQDPAVAAQADLMAATPEDAGRGALYLAAPVRLTPAELDWVERAMTCGAASVFLQAQPGDIHAPALGQLRVTPGRVGTSQEDAYAGFLDAALQVGADLRQRSREFLTRHPINPAGDRLRILALDGPEQEAAAVDVQVRRWLLASRRRIGVVTDDRRLARRLRALLERAGIALVDASGWALSTTSAAAALERWLECVEEDFPEMALRDLLKSPFVLADLPREERMGLVYRLERDIIRHEKIARGLGRYRRHLEYRERRLAARSGDAPAALGRLLARLEEAASSLAAAAAGGALPARQLLESLQRSLERLGARAALEADPAGRAVLDELARMELSLAEEDSPMDWSGFRSWLGRRLECASYAPEVETGPVELVSLAESQLLGFDALVVAGADRTHLPGAPGGSPLFNESVRRELELPGREERNEERRFLFRRLLQAAPSVLITVQSERDGEPVSASPWVEQLRAFSELTYGDRLDDPVLRSLIHDPSTQIRLPQSFPLPSLPQRPAPILQPALIPRAVSASAYQQLMDCPYQFYAAVCLGLSPLEEIREALQKSDYGERVHRCLQAFHSPVPGLPPPHGGPLDEEDRAAAVDHLRRISRTVFAQDLEDSFEHRGWLRRWEELIPRYVDWAIARAQAWVPESVELRVEQPLGPGGTVLKARLDRLDRSHSGTGVVDYKTGLPPSQRDVESGEAVQLPFYAALLAPPPHRAEYLALEGRGKGARLEGEQLEELSRLGLARLGNLLSQITEGVPMPAWGDPATCGHCPMDGLCRRGHWQDAAGAARP